MPKKKIIHVEPDMPTASVQAKVKDVKKEKTEAQPTKANPKTDPKARMSSAANNNVAEDMNATKESFSGLSKSQKKNLKRKLAKKDNRRDSNVSVSQASSAVPKTQKDAKKKKKTSEMPRDPLHEERESVLTHLRGEFESLSKYLTNEITRQQNANENPQKQAAYTQLVDSLVRQIDDACTRQQKHVKRPENKRLQASELLSEIQEIELAKANLTANSSNNEKVSPIHTQSSTQPPTHTQIQTTVEDLTSVGVATSNAVENEETLAWLRDQLVVAVSFEQHKKFQKSLNDLKARCSTLLDEISKAQNEASKSRQKEKIHQRLKVLKQYKPNSAHVNDTSEIVTQTFELPVDVMNHLFSNMNFAKRLEKIYTVAIDRPRSDKKKQGTMMVSGLDQDVKEFADYVSNVKLVRLNAALDPRVIAAVIGKQGSGIKNLEDTFSCFLHVESNNEIVAIGRQSNCDRALKHIETIKFEPTETFSHAEVTCNPDVLRFLEANEMSELQKIANNTNTTINLQKPSTIHVRGPADKIDNAVAQVNTLKQPIIVHTLKAPEENIRKLFYGNREISPSVRQYFDVLKEFRKVRLEEKAASGQVKLIGRKKEIDGICDSLIDLLEKAGFVYHRVPLDPEHSHIFRDDALARVGVECSCDLRVVRSKEKDGQTILIHGSESAKDAAVKMIKHIIDTEGRTLTVNVEPETFAMLVVNRMHKITEIQDLTGAYVKIDRKKRNEVVVIGTDKAVNEAQEMITDLDKALKQQRAEESTEEITIDKSQTGILIGVRGQTVAYLLDKSKASRIDVDKNNPGKVIIKGKPECVEKAKKLIEEVLNRNRTSGEAKEGDEAKSGSSPKKSGKGFYGRHSPQKKPAHEDAPKQSKLPAQQVNTEDKSVFPSITDAAKMKQRRHNYRKQHKQKNSNQQDKPQTSSSVSSTPLVPKEIHIETKPVQEIPIETKPIQEIPIETKPVQEIPIETKPVESLTHTSGGVQEDSNLLSADVDDKNTQFYSNKSEDGSDDESDSCSSDE